MGKPTSRITSQGQVSVPAEVRKRLGLSSGSVLEWDARDDACVVRRVGKFSSEDMHRALFASRPSTKKLSDFKLGIRRLMRQRHARR